MPVVQEVIEVGEIGSAPLRMPRATAKARRDLPLWRQPLVLAAEGLVLTVAVLGGWLLLRSEPAIAFAERDWVVLGDVDNLTGDPIFDDSMRHAIRIALEQSRYVNVLSEGKIRESTKWRGSRAIPGSAAIPRPTWRCGRARAPCCCRRCGRRSVATSWPLMSPHPAPAR